MARPELKEVGLLRDGFVRPGFAFRDQKAGNKGWKKYWGLWLKNNCWHGKKNQTSLFGFFFFPNCLNIDRLGNVSKDQVPLKRINHFSHFNVLWWVLSETLS